MCKEVRGGFWLSVYCAPLRVLALLVLRFTSLHGFVTGCRGQAGSLHDPSSIRNSQFEIRHLPFNNAIANPQSYKYKYEAMRK